MICAGMAKVNPGFRMFTCPVALSNGSGISTISVALTNSGWNMIVPEFMPKENMAYSCEVQTDRPDSNIDKNCVGRIALIKIDTEGYEFPVLRGLEGYFGRGDRPAVICEVAPAAYRPLGYSLSDLYDYMHSYGYCSFLIGELAHSFLWICAKHRRRSMLYGFHG
jgi:FkbM family methyltransferase